MYNQTPPESTTLNSFLKATLGVTLVATGTYVVSRLLKKAESDKRLKRMESILNQLEKEHQKKTV